MVEAGTAKFQRDEIGLGCIAYIECIEVLHCGERVKYGVAGREIADVSNMQIALKQRASRVPPSI